ncbi:MAG: hypothetical protein ACO1RX_12375 [Candidatus Sericytochromatia bacterium]
MIAVLIKTHFIDAALCEHLRQLQQELRQIPGLEGVLSVDVLTVSPALQTASLAELPGWRLHAFNSQNYAEHGLLIHPGVAQKGVPVNWFHSDYSLLDFYLRHPGRYTAFWQIEYDVSLRKGSWDFLAREFDCDLMAASLKIKEMSFKHLVQSPCLFQPGWHWWDKLIGHFATVGCFFPCVRLTSRALDTLLAAYRRGVTGYCEVSVPSVIASNFALRIGGLDAIDPAEVELMHPHWDKRRREEPGSAFQLNLPGLNVDL